MKGRAEDCLDEEFLCLQVKPLSVVGRIAVGIDLEWNTQSRCFGVNPASFCTKGKGGRLTCNMRVEGEE